MPSAPRPIQAKKATRAMRSRMAGSKGLRGGPITIERSERQSEGTLIGAWLDHGMRRSRSRFQFLASCSRPACAEHTMNVDGCATVAYFQVRFASAALFPVAPRGPNDLLHPAASA